MLFKTIGSNLPRSSFFDSTRAEEDDEEDDDEEDDDEEDDNEEDDARLLFPQ